jgi:hypothetical protein
MQVNEKNEEVCDTFRKCLLQLIVLDSFIAETDRQHSDKEKELAKKEEIPIPLARRQKIDG